MEVHLFKTASLIWLSVSLPKSQSLAAFLKQVTNYWTVSPGFCVIRWKVWRANAEFTCGMHEIGVESFISTGVICSIPSFSELKVVNIFSTSGPARWSNIALHLCLVAAVVPSLIISPFPSAYSLNEVNHFFHEGQSSLDQRNNQTSVRRSFPFLCPRRQFIDPKSNK